MLHPTPLSQFGSQPERNNNISHASSCIHPTAVVLHHIQDLPNRTSVRQKKTIFNYRCQTTQVAGLTNRARLSFTTLTSNAPSLGVVSHYLHNATHLASHHDIHPYKSPLTPFAPLLHSRFTVTVIVDTSFFPSDHVFRYARRNYQTLVTSVETSPSTVHAVLQPSCRLILIASRTVTIARSASPESTLLSSASGLIGLVPKRQFAARGNCRCSDMSTRANRHRSSVYYLHVFSTHSLSPSCFSSPNTVSNFNSKLPYRLVFPHLHKYT